MIRAMEIAASLLGLEHYEPAVRENKIDWGGLTG
jgi:hypothetical protein